MDTETGRAGTLLALTADIVAAHVGNNQVDPGDIPALIRDVHGALTDVGSGAREALPRPEPAVPVRSSVKPDYIVCLEDGRKLKMLKRHLMATYNLTPDQYRERWNLPPDYPMVAPNYAERRRTLARQIGLGTRARVD